MLKRHKKCTTAQKVSIFLEDFFFDSFDINVVYFFLSRTVVSKEKIVKEVKGFRLLCLSLCFNKRFLHVKMYEDYYFLEQRRNAKQHYDKGRRQQRRNNS